MLKQSEISVFTVPGSSNSAESDIADFKNWSMKECGDIFVKSLTALHKRVKEGGPDTILVWDKVTLKI